MQALDVEDVMACMSGGQDTVGESLNMCNGQDSCLYVQLCKDGMKSECFSWKPISVPFLS